MKNPKPRRFGKLTVMEAVIDNEEVSSEIFRQLGFVPWQVQYQHDTGVFEMLGTSPMFDELEPLSPAPHYDVHIEEKYSDEGVHLNVTAERKL